MIKDAIVSDAKQLAKIKVDTWKTTYKGIIPDKFLNELSYEKEEERFKKFLKNPGSNKFIIVYENEKTSEIISYMWFGVPKEDEDNNYDQEIYALYVLKDYQKGGIGREMINFAIERLKKTGNTSLILWTLKKNLNARSFYQKIGFRLTKEKIKNIGGRDIDECGYELNPKQIERKIC